MKCPVCNSELKVINSQHIESKKHRKALKDANISEEEDPALEFLNLSQEECEELIEGEEEKMTENSRDNQVMEMLAPEVPEPPKPEKKLSLENSDLSISVMDEIKDIDSESTNVVLVNCERCGKVIPVPIKKNLIYQSELPVVPISYIHYNSDGKDLHSLTVYLDHDFDIRRQRYSDVIFSKKILIKKSKD